MPRTPSLWREFFAILLRCPRPSAQIAAKLPPERRFAAAHGPVSSILIPVVLVGLMGDVPLSWVIVALCSPSHPWLVHALIACTGIYVVCWAIAVRSVIATIPHVIDEHVLWLNGGARHSCRIPRHAIRRIHSFQGSRLAWAATQGVPASEMLLVNGIDPPNVAVELEEQAVGVVRIEKNGKAVAPRRWILLYTDSPEGLMLAVS